MSWEKQGLVFSTASHHAWNKTHAQVPVVDDSDQDVWRIYYATRDVDGRSRTSYIEVEAGNPQRILYEHDVPILDLGAEGAADDCGVMPSWIVTHGKAKFLYYIGWTIPETFPYHNSVCLAVSEDGGRTFRKEPAGALLKPTSDEPYFTGTSCVRVERGRWRMWYLSCTKWETFEGKDEAFYHIKYAESDDGIHWDRRGVVAVDYASEVEGGIASASVLEDSGRYRMWYSYRGAYGYRTDRSKSYRIGYAESTDGVEWQRRDELAGIDVAEEGWDSEMIAYPHVVVYGDREYMFYNGNGFGRSGLGYATRRRSPCQAREGIPRG